MPQNDVRLLEYEHRLITMHTGTNHWRPAVSLTQSG